MTTDQMISAGVSTASFFSALILCVMLLMKHYRWLRVLPCPPSAVMRLRVIDPDGTERSIEFARLADDVDGPVDRRYSTAERNLPVLRPSSG